MGHDNKPLINQKFLDILKQTGNVCMDVKRFDKALRRVARRFLDKKVQYVWRDKPETFRSNERKELYHTTIDILKKELESITGFEKVVIRYLEPEKESDRPCIIIERGL